MANKNLFGRPKVVVPVANARNAAGGRAYSTSDESALAQYICTGTLNGTFYASANEQLDTILALASGCSSDFIARAAVYAHKVARMKDTPALLLAVLLGRDQEAKDLLGTVFSQVCSNAKMVRNFVQIVRSGVAGRKNLGHVGRKLIRSWLRSRTSTQLFRDSIGTSPSLADVVKMVHVRPDNKEKEAFYGWLLNKPVYNKNVLPALLKHYESYKAGETKEVPDVNFQMLSALKLGKKEWSAIARRASWNTARMNLNTFMRHGVLDDSTIVNSLAEKLADRDEVKKNNAFPYQLLTSYQNTEGKIPQKLSLALQDALEVATENIPQIKGRVCVAVDVSGSMNSPVTGNRGTATTATTCTDVAGLIAACILRQNPDSVVVPFDTQVKSVTLNPRDSVVTNAKKLSLHGGGTDCSSALRHLNATNWKGDVVIYVSDNQSWYLPNAGSYGQAGGVATEWAKFKQRNKGAKLVCINLQPEKTVQKTDDKDVLNMGGWSDAAFKTVANFVVGDQTHHADVIRKFALDERAPVVYNSLSNEEESEDESEK